MNGYSHSKNLMDVGVREATTLVMVLLNPSIFVEKASSTSFSFEKYDDVIQVSKEGNGICYFLISGV